MLRAFRVFRLFKRIQSLNKIITSLGYALPGIFNAGAVMFVVMCIYAILGVDMFSEFGKDGTYLTVENTTVPLVTNRGMTYGEEYYGNFGRSLFTLFQVMTGESWSEVVARPAVFGSGIEYRSIFFYTTYVLICSIILVNVAVAVLLEKMVDSDPSTDGLDVNVSRPGSPDTVESPGGGAAKDAIYDMKRAFEADVQKLREEASEREQRLRDEAEQREKRLLDAIEVLSGKLVEATESVSSATFKRKHRSSKHREQHGIHNIQQSIEDVQQDGAPPSTTKVHPGRSVSRQASFAPINEANGCTPMTPGSDQLVA